MSPGSYSTYYETALSNHTEDAWNYSVATTPHTFINVQVREDELSLSTIFSTTVNGNMYQQRVENYRMEVERYGGEINRYRERMKEEFIRQVQNLASSTTSQPLYNFTPPPIADLYSHTLQPETTAKRKEAKDKALKTLKESLYPYQLERFLKDKCIPVDAKSGNRYLIKRGFQQNIYRLDTHGEEVETLCAHISQEFSCPEYDHMLAQKLYLECDEEGFLSKANKRPLPLGLNVGCAFPDFQITTGETTTVDSF